MTFLKNKALCNKVESNVWSLNGMDMSKLPNELQILVTGKFDKNSWKFSSLLESFKTELEAREQCNVVNNTMEGNAWKQDGKPRGIRNTDQFSASSLMASGSKISWTYF